MISTRARFRQSSKQKSYKRLLGTFFEKQRTIQPMNYFAHASAAERYATARPYFHPKALELLLEATNQKRFAHALDVACGTGMGTKALLEIADVVTGCDTSPEMLLFAQRGVPEAKFLESQAETLPFAGSSFDLITTFLAFHWFDGEKFLEEATRVLQTNGYLVIVQHIFNSTLEHHEAFKSSMDAFYADYPQPPRNPLRLEPTAATNFGFRMVAKYEWHETFSMNAKEVAAYISTQSNIIAKVEQGMESLEAVLKTIETRADLFLQGQSGQFGFTGLLWVLQAGQSDCAILQRFGASGMTAQSVEIKGLTMQKVMVIGNGGGGKTMLSQRLAEHHHLPLTEIDALQFQAGWQQTEAEQLAQAITEIQSAPRWLIDGFGSWDLIVERANLADTIVFVDHPIWVHFWWACERQMAAARGEKRLGGPTGCDLREVTKEMFETIWWVHENLRPKLVDLVEHHRSSKEVWWIRSPEQLDRVLSGLK